MRHLITSPLAEAFFGGVKNKHGYAEVFQDPTPEELGQLDVENVGVLVTHEACFFWDRSVALHARVISELNLHGTLPLLANFDEGWDSYEAWVSDTVRGTEFDHSPHIRQFLEDHEFMSLFTINSLHYYDESTEGDWAELADNEEEDDDGVDIGGYTSSDDPYGDGGSSRYLGLF